VVSSPDFQITKLKMSKVEKLKNSKREIAGFISACPTVSPVEGVAS
jgi:hypothetical protein